MLDLFEFPYLLYKEKNIWNESLGYTDPGGDKLGKLFGGIVNFEMVIREALCVKGRA